MFGDDVVLVDRLLARRHRRGDRWRPAVAGIARASDAKRSRSTSSTNFGLRWAAMTSRASSPRFRIAYVGADWAASIAAISSSASTSQPFGNLDREPRPVPLVVGDHRKVGQGRARQVGVLGRAAAPGTTPSRTGTRSSRPPRAPIERATDGRRPPVIRDARGIGEQPEVLEALRARVDPPCQEVVGARRRRATRSRSGGGRGARARSSSRPPRGSRPAGAPSGRRSRPGARAFRERSEPFRPDGRSTTTRKVTLSVTSRPAPPDMERLLDARDADLAEGEPSVRGRSRVDVLHGLATWARLKRLARRWRGRPRHPICPGSIRL